MGHVATVRVEKQACSGSAPRMDRRQRRVFFRGQGEAVLALRKMESKEEGVMDRERWTETEKEREKERERKKQGRNDNWTERKALSDLH